MSKKYCNPNSVVSEFDENEWIDQKITGQKIRRYPIAFYRKIARENAIMDAKNGKPSFYCDICGKKYGQTFIKLVDNWNGTVTNCLDCHDKLKNKA